MSPIAVIVIAAEIGTVLFFIAYGTALCQWMIEGRRQGRQPRLDTTGTAVVTAARLGFLVGLGVLIVSSISVGVA